MECARQQKNAAHRQCIHFLRWSKHTYTNMICIRYTWNERKKRAEKQRKQDKNEAEEIKTNELHEW